MKTETVFLRILLTGLIMIALPSAIVAQTPTDLPRLSKADIQFEGAFRIKAAIYGSSETNYAQGPIEYNPTRNSIFFVGHTHHQQIAELTVPVLVKSATVSELNMSSTALQEFSTSPLYRTPDNNPQKINQVTGMLYFSGPNGPELIVNGQEYYDGDASNSHTTVVVRNAHDISDSQVDGYYQFPARAHASGWISPIPLQWQSLLGGSYITGNSSGWPIIGRLSVGPAAFVFNPLDLVGNSSPLDPVPTNTLLDYSLSNPLHGDLSNSDLNNKLWTHLSRAVYGFVVPGTRTYAVFGSSGGHESGICYKCTQDTGNTCGGYCPRVASDQYHYYWLYDLVDMLDVKNGVINSWNPRPYEYGKFQLPFSGTALGGGTFDPTTGRLYLSASKADSEQGPYANPPIIIAYQFNVPGRSDVRPPTNLRVHQ